MLCAGSWASGGSTVAGRRVDVFSLKGGVGKTTLAVLLARAQAQVSQKPVLIVDADLTGTCLGDLLQGWADPGWHELENLAHLVCGPPELLSERLRAPPLYVLPTQTPTASEYGAVQPWSTGAEAPPPGLYFCPSHPESDARSALPHVSAAVLNALLAHESGARWVLHVIARLIAATETQAVLGPLGGVLVDHGPGMGALQRQVFEALDAGGASRGLLVTACDAVDLLAMQTFDGQVRDQRPALVWCVNRVEQPEDGWRRRHRPPYIRAPEHEAGASRADEVERTQARFGAWYEQLALPFPDIEALAQANAGGQLAAWGLATQDTAWSPVLEALRARLFDDAPPAA